MTARPLTLYLVRHGETHANQNHLLAGTTDVLLTARGKAQAAALAPRLSSLRFDGVWSSHLRRAIHTAEIAHSAPTVDQRLRELDFGQLEGHPWHELPPETMAQLQDFPNFQAPGGESVQAMGERLMHFVDELEGHHLIFAHGGVIRFFHHLLDSSYFPANASLSIVEWSPKRALLEIYNPPSA